MSNYTSNPLKEKQYGYQSAFLSYRRFYDDKNFPKFFHRSGDFSIKEADVLTVTGYVMTQLKNGELQPQSPEHKHFLEVINGKKAAESIEEKIYVKYLQLIQEKQKIFPPVKNNVSKVSYINMDDDDFSYANDGY